MLAFITEKKVVKEILEHLGLPSTGPPIAHARIAPQAKTPPGRTTCPSCSKRCADGGQAGLRVCLDFAVRGGVAHSRRVLLA